MAWCGIDIGTQGVRAVVLGPDGSVLGAGSAALTRSHRDGSVHEQAPETWWIALCDAVRGALAAAAPSGAVVEAVALDATSGTVLVEDANGNAVGPALMYDDGRAAQEAEEASIAGASLWSELGYRMQPVWALPKTLWLLRHGHVGQTDHVVHQSDHLVRRLVGEPVPTDTSNALKTGADLRSVEWPHDVFALLRLPGGVLPELVLPGTAIGEISHAAAESTGLPAGAVVRAGMTDGCAAQIAAGALATGKWSSALGTTLVVKGSTSELLKDPTGAVYSHRHPDGGWLPGGASSSGAAIIASEFAGADLDELTEAAADLAPTSGLTYPLSGVGERFPFVKPDAFGFTPPESRTRAERFADICQAVAFVERLAYDVLADLGAPVHGPIAFTGGGTRNRWWNQLRTDVLGLRTVVPASSEAAVGMAVLAAADPGQLTHTARRMIRIDQHYEPDTGRQTRFEPAYRAFIAELVSRGWLAGAPKGIHS